MHIQDFEEQDDTKEKTTQQGEKSKPKVINTSIICNILIPLIVGLLITTSLAITIIFILSPYWAKSGGQQSIYDQTSVLNSLCSVIGQSISNLLQRTCDVRSQILLYYWRNVQLINIDQKIMGMAQNILDNRCFNIAAIQEDTFSLQTIPYYDGVTQQSLSSVDWGIVSELGVLDVTKTGKNDLTNEQRTDLLLFSSTLPIMMSTQNSNPLYKNHIFFHSITGMFVQYPLSFVSQYTETPIQKMQKNYMDDPKNVIFADFLDPLNGKILSCICLISPQQKFLGIMCMEIQVQSLQDTLSYIATNIPNELVLYAIFSNPTLNIMASSIPNLNRKVQDSQVVYSFPRLLDVLFPSENNINEKTSFIEIFSPLLYNIPESRSTLLYSSPYQKDGTTFQANVREIYQFEFGINQNLDGSYVQESIIMIELMESVFFDTFSDLATQLQNQSLFQILVMSVPIAIVMCLVAWYIAYKIIRGIAIPLQDLIHKLTLLTKDTLTIAIYSNFRQSSYELNLLYETFHRLITVLNFSNPKYFEGDDAELLMKFSQGLLLFQRMRNTSGIGVNLNNIANIHRKNQRFEEAINCYRDSLFICELDILKITNKKKIELVYPILKQNHYFNFTQLGKETVLERQNSTVNQFRSNNEIKKSKVLRTQTTLQRYSQMSQKLRSSKDVDDQKLQLEEIYSNRNYSLAITLIEQSKAHLPKPTSFHSDGDLMRIQSLPDNVETLYKESIDRLNFTIHLDQKLNLCTTLLCQAHLELEDIKVAKEQIEAAEQLQLNYEQWYEDKIKRENEVPPGVLKQLVLLQKGLLCKKHHKLKTASLLFTESLESSKYYDPDIRLRSLENLHEILVRQNLIDKAPNVTKLLQQSQRKKNKDIVFIVDFSESMQNEKKEFAIKFFQKRGILKIFDHYLLNQDRVSFMRFNQILNVVFELTEKGENPKFLRNSIENSLDLMCKGETALLQAIIYGTQILRKAIQRDHQKWIVIMTDGEDNLSKISFNKMKKVLTSLPDASLIIIGIALAEECIEELNDLCRMTKEGLFIQSVDSEDLDIAFQALTNLITGNVSSDYNVEYLTH